MVIRTVLYSLALYVICKYTIIHVHCEDCEVCIGRCKFENRTAGTLKRIRNYNTK